MNLIERIEESLQRLKAKGSLRRLYHQPQLVDFCSNDYLGLARSEVLKLRVAERYADQPQSGATGSRLLSGHHPLMEALEGQLCRFHLAETALLFNSGYDANLSLFATLPRRGDIILYDALVHASIHDGMYKGKGEAIVFRHNDIADLRRLLEIHQSNNKVLFVAIESVYSMDGDIAPLAEMVALCQDFGANLIIDEAHATGVLGTSGEGLVASLGLQDEVFARVHTFGKAIGGHGAAVLGSAQLREYLINFARPLIFSTAMPLHSVMHASEAYRLLELHGSQWVSDLQEKVNLFLESMQHLAPSCRLTHSQTPIQGILLSGNAQVLAAAQTVQAAGFDLRPIRYPTVPLGQERLRVCLHLFNSQEEIAALTKIFSAT